MVSSQAFTPLLTTPTVFRLCDKIYRSLGTLYRLRLSALSPVRRLNHDRSPTVYRPIPSPHSFAFSRAPQGPQRHAPVRLDDKLHRSQHHPNGLSGHSLGPCGVGNMVPFTTKHIGLQGFRHDIRLCVHACERVLFLLPFVSSEWW